MAFSLDNLKNMSDVKDVWDNLQEKNWQGLFNAVRKVREEKGGNATLDKLEETGQKAKSDGQDFPNSPADLAKMVNR